MTVQLAKHCPMRSMNATLFAVIGPHTGASCIKLVFSELNMKHYLLGTFL